VRCVEEERIGDRCCKTLGKVGRSILGWYLCTGNKMSLHYFSIRLERKLTSVSVQDTFDLLEILADIIACLGQNQHPSTGTFPRDSLRQL
jgi:hypothetical protein